MFYWGLVASALIAISFMIGLPGKAIGVARAYTIILCLLVVPCFLYALKDTGISLRYIVRAVGGYIVISFLTVMLTQLVFGALPHGSLIANLLIKSVVGGCIYVALTGLLVMLDPAQAAVRDVALQSLSALKRFSSRRGSPA